MYGVSEIEHSRRPHSLAGTFADIAKCLSPASFWMPRWIVSSEWSQHAPFAFWLIDTARPRTVVEWRTYSGFSYLTLCQAVQDLGLSKTCRAVGYWAGDRYTGFAGEGIFSELKDYHDSHYAGFSQLTRSSVADCLDSFSEQSIDLLHIDGYGLHDDVLETFESWLPKLSKTAILLLHNTNEDETEFGVAKLWSELRARYPSFEFKHGRGLGILAVGSEMPLSLRPLFLATDSSREAIGQIYERLGLSIRDQIDLNALRQKESEELALLEAELKARGEAFRGLQGEIQELRSALIAYPADEIAALRAERDRKDRDLATMAGALAEKAIETSSLKAEVAAHQEVHASLEVANEQLARSLDRSAFLEERLGALEIELAGSLNQSKSLEQQLEAGNQELARSLDRSKSLEQQLEATNQELAGACERLAAIESSRSWKVTKPLRSLSDALRRFTRRAG